ncbi:hypothetical protein Hanom_Chr04g00334071 [Helianthus anomalus]
MVRVSFGSALVRSNPVKSAVRDGSGSDSVQLGSTQCSSARLGPSQSTESTQLTRSTLSALRLDSFGNSLKILFRCDILK